MYESHRPRYGGGLWGFFKNYLQELKDAKLLAEKINPETDILNPHDQEAYRVAAYFKKRVKNIPSVWMMNDMPTRSFSLLRDRQFDETKRVSVFKIVFNEFFDIFETWRFINAQDVIAVLDERDQRWAEKSFAPKAVVVRSGIDIKNFSFCERTTVLKTDIKILSTGILLPHRRFEDLIDAVALLREKGYNASCAIVGEYSHNARLYDALVNRAEKAGIAEYINFVGRVSDDELKAYYRTSDIFVFPCHLQSWGLAVFEAMASGMPVVVSKTSGASEILTHEKTALLVDARAPEHIATAVAHLVDDGNLYNELSKNGREFVEKNLSWEKYTDAMLKIFEETAQ